MIMLKRLYGVDWLWVEHDGEHTLLTHYGQTTTHDFFSSMFNKHVWWIYVHVFGVAKTNLQPKQTVSVPHRSSILFLTDRCAASELDGMFIRCAAAAAVVSTRRHHHHMAEAYTHHKIESADTHYRAYGWISTYRM